MNNSSGISVPGSPVYGRHTMRGWQGDRYAFEMFLQSQRLLTRKYAAARLGMEPDSLDRLLPELPRIGLSKKYAVYRGITDESVSEDLVRTLPGLRFRTFGTHDSFCELLHGALHQALELEIRPLFCATADQLGDQRMYASTWDNITLLPLSVKHSLWLDFKKPLDLSPDRCSKLFFARHRDELRTHLAGREEPRDMRYYMDFAGGRRDLGWPELFLAQRGLPPRATEARRAA